MMRELSLFVVSLVVLVALILPVSAKIIYVPDDYAKIQWAVDNASAGDTIIVKSGTYYEHVNVTKQLTLRGVDTGRGMPVVDADGSGDAITISADGVTLEGFVVISGNAGIKVISDNNVISNNTISNNDDGIRLDYSSSNTIYNNIISNNHYGIYLYKSSDNTISNNTVSNNAGDGIRLYYSSSNIISNNTISNNDYGIYLYESSSNTISNNIIVYASCWDDGIYLEESSGNKISNNIVSNNAGDGICLYESSGNTISNNTVSNNGYDGISLDYSSGNIISNNTVSDNDDDGIDLSGSSNNKIYNNTVSNNGDYGIYLDYSSNNKIYLNNFIDNNHNVYSHDSMNIWNSPEKITYTYNGKTFTNYLGNYWSDYTGVDSNGDGIGDTPYKIDENNIDYYPLIQSFSAYVGVANPPTVNVTNVIVSSATATVGQEFEIEVYVDNVTDLAGYQFDVAYDPSVVQFVKADKGDAIADWEIFSYNNISENEVRVSAQKFTGTAFTGSGVIAVLKFKAIAEGTSVLDINDGMLSDSTGNTIEAVWEDGNVTVLATHYIETSPQSLTISPTSTATVDIVLNEVPMTGLSYAYITVSISNSSIARIEGIEYPSWATLNSNSSFPSSTVWFKVGDLNNQVKAGDTNVVLATLTIKGLSEGTSEIIITVNSLQDDNYAEIKDQIATIPGTITVIAGPPPINDHQPKDLNRDGKFEDVNGDNNFNFGDIVFFFQNFDKPEIKNYPNYYDFNGDGNVNFGDVVALFKML